MHHFFSKLLVLCASIGASIFVGIGANAQSSGKDITPAAITPKVITSEHHVESYIELKGTGCFSQPTCPKYSLKITPTDELIFTAPEHNFSRTVGEARRALPVGSYTRLLNGFEAANFTSLPARLNSNEKTLCGITPEQAEAKGYSFRPPTTINIQNTGNIQKTDVKLHSVYYDWMCGAAGGLDTFENAIWDVETLIDLNALLYWPDYDEKDVANYSLQQLRFWAEYKKETPMRMGCDAILQQKELKKKEHTKKRRIYTRLCEKLSYLGDPYGQYVRAYMYEHGTNAVYRREGQTAEEDARYYRQAEYTGFGLAVDTVNAHLGMCEAKCEKAEYQDERRELYRYGELEVFDANGVVEAAYERCRRIWEGYAPGRRMDEMVPFCERGFAGGMAEAGLVLSRIYGPRLVKETESSEEDGSVAEYVSGYFPTPDPQKYAVWQAQTRDLLETQAQAKNVRALEILGDLTYKQEDRTEANTWYVKTQALTKNRTDNAGRHIFLRVSLKLSEGENASLDILKSLQALAATEYIPAQEDMARIYTTGWFGIHADTRLAGKWTGFAVTTGSQRGYDMGENELLPYVVPKEKNGAKKGKVKYSAAEISKLIRHPLVPDEAHEDMDFLSLHQGDCPRDIHSPTLHACPQYVWKIYADDTYGFQGRAHTLHEGVKLGHLSKGTYAAIQSLLSAIDFDEDKCSGYAAWSRDIAVEIKGRKHPNPKPYNEDADIFYGVGCLRVSEDEKTKQLGAFFHEQTIWRQHTDAIRALLTPYDELVKFPDLSAAGLPKYSMREMGYYTAEHPNNTSVGLEYCRRRVDDTDKLTEGEWEYFARESVLRIALIYCARAAEGDGVEALMFLGRLDEQQAQRPWLTAKKKKALEKSAIQHYKRAEYFGHKPAREKMDALVENVSKDCCKIEHFDLAIANTYSYAQLERFAENGSVSAKHRLCERRTYVRRSSHDARLEAMSLCQAAVKAGSFLSARTLRNFKDTAPTSIPKQQWLKTYKTMLQQSAENGDIYAMWQYAEAFQGDDGKAWAEKARLAITPAAEAGDRHAQYYLGQILWRLSGDKQEKMQGIDWLEKSAAQGDVAAMVTLGSIYSYNPLVKDHNKVYASFREAIRLGDFIAVDTLRNIQDSQLQY